VAQTGKRLADEAACGGDLVITDGLDNRSRLDATDVSRGHAIDVPRLQLRRFVAARSPQRRRGGERRRPVNRGGARSTICRAGRAARRSSAVRRLNNTAVKQSSRNCGIST